MVSYFKKLNFSYYNRIVQGATLEHQSVFFITSHTLKVLLVTLQPFIIQSLMLKQVLNALSVLDYVYSLDKPEIVDFDNFLYLLSSELPVAYNSNKASLSVVIFINTSPL